MRRSLVLASGAAILALSLVPPDGAEAGRRRGGGGTQNAHEAIGHQTFASPQSNPIAHSPTQDRVYVANTTSNTVDVIDTNSNSVIATIAVGIDPVGIAVRPDGNEVWVSNHISDSVSVIDTQVGSASLHQVVATVQDLDANGVSQFDEPVGIAFASNTKAYVALSSRNDIAVVDASTYTVTSRIHITAQDPRALVVRGGQLYVAAFESGNTTELSVCPEVAVPPGDPPQCTLDLDDITSFVIESPNIPASDTRIVRDPDVPDRDLYVIDTTSDSVIGVLEALGTLLYGVTVDSSGKVFLSLTEARNDVNGADGENLIEMDNRMFLNQIVEVDCGGSSCDCTGGPPAVNPICAVAPTIHELEPLPPSQPAFTDALATPYGIQISADDSTLVVTAAASSRIFTFSTATGNVLDRLDVGAIPRGVAFDSTGATGTAYVLNTLGNSVSVVSVGSGGSLSLITTVPVGSDPTPNDVRLGRIAFNDANASSTGTFACASCHPDGMNDQLLWRIGGACFFQDCTGDDEIRSTMPVRGLKNTVPLHWDGTLGDPFGGIDGSTGPSGGLGFPGPNPADCSLGGPDGDHDCFRHLVDASQAGVMCDQSGGCANGPSGLPGLLTATERDNMAAFLGGTNASGTFVGGGIPYPPARERPVSDVVSSSALTGFSDFFVDQPGGLFSGDNGDPLGVFSCADMNSGCHALPLGADHNSSTLAGFDAPTMRGMTDRVLHFSLGITNAEENLVDARDPVCVTIQGIQLCSPGSDSYGLGWDPDQGFDELVSFAAAFAIFDQVYGSGPNDQFQMFEEASTGFSGAVGRQVTLDNVTTAGCVATHACDDPGICDTMAQLCELEAADARGVVNLRGEGTRNGNPRTFSYNFFGQYEVGDGTFKRSRAQLIAEAQSIASPYIRVVLTGHLRSNFGTERQPLLSLTSTNDGTLGPLFPQLPNQNPMVLKPTDVSANALVFVDGQPATLAAPISCSGSFPCTDPETLTINLDLGAAPLPEGLHLLQVGNPAGPLSNELPICATPLGSCR